jgi:glycosyltransferase involved in cell wall biosynthesis
MKVSVIIPFYNRHETLRTSLPSVLAQTLPAHEILLINDCSKEDISWVAQEFPTVKVVHMPQNRGPGFARYHGAKMATGTHVATLDADDFWYPEKLEKQVAFATRTGDPRAIYGHAQFVKEDHGGSVRPNDGPRPGEPTIEYIYVRNHHIQSSTFLVEKELYKELVYVSDEFYADDYVIVMRADVVGCKVYFQKEPLSQWNCTTDPKRGSILTSDKTYARDFLPRQSIYFTPKAKAAFRGRWLAPRLLKQGQFFDGVDFLGQAVLQKALSPVAAAKIFLLATCPGLFKKAAFIYAGLRAPRPAEQKA